MASNIYKFFDFLEKKVGKTLPSDRKFNMKLQHAKELIDDKDINALPLERKMIYYPERVAKQDLIIKGEFTLPTEARKIPEGLVVKGKLRVTGELDAITNNVQATSVFWSTSSDYYPRSFNGATFKEFSTSWSKETKKLPNNIKVTDTLRIDYSNVETLPEGLKTNYINAAKSKLQKLPANLECNKLDITSTQVTEIPQGVVVHEKLDIDTMPKKYPQHLENVIVIAGGATIAQLREFEKVPKIVASVGNKTKKGQGIAVPLSDVRSKQVTEFIDSYGNKYDTLEEVVTRIANTVREASKAFGVKFDTLYLFASHKRGFQLEYFVKGKTQQGDEILATHEAVLSAQGQTKSVAYARREWELTDRQLKDAQDKLFPQAGEKPTKVPNIRTLMNGPQSKEVFWAIGRKQRGGTGIQGKAKDLIPSLSGVSQDNMERYAKQAGVTWGDMMVFDNNDAINIIAKSNERDQDGNFTYFDKFGYGQGGGSRIFTGPDYTII